MFVYPKEPKDRIIVALDVSTADEAKELIDQLAPHVGMFKVGLELFVSTGPAIVQVIRAAHSECFLDLKFHDIPTTVGRASAKAAALGVSMFNVHASNNIEAMEAAVKNKGGSLVLAVTVLTSFSDDNTREIYNAPTQEKVLQLALLAERAGVDGIICAPTDLEFLRMPWETNRLLFVTPGVRPAWAQSNDQKRVTTPMEATLAGSDHLVIGRPITNPPSEIGSSVEAAKRIAQEIEEALAVIRERGGGRTAW